MSAPTSTKPRGSRVACSLRSSDGANGVFSVYPGTEPKTLASKDEIKWDKTPTGPVVQGVFTIIGEMGMTGQVILLDQPKWDALQKSKLISHFFIAMLWGGMPLKIVDDAVMMAKRGA
ncbi:MAG: hypothetical protein ACM36B_12535 [Bacteroidota bacterium]